MTRYWLTKQSIHIYICMHIHHMYTYIRIHVNMLLFFFGFSTKRFDSLLVPIFYTPTAEYTDKHTDFRGGEKKPPRFDSVF